MKKKSRSTLHLIEMSAMDLTTSIASSEHQKAEQAINSLKCLLLIARRTHAIHGSAFRDIYFQANKIHALLRGS